MDDRQETALADEKILDKVRKLMAKAESTNHEAEAEGRTTRDKGDRMTILAPTDEQLAARKTWVEALRSDNYDQAEGVLRSMTSEYNYDTGQTVLRDSDGKKKCCCLGVVCDIAPVGKWADDHPDIFLLAGDRVRDDNGQAVASQTWDAMPPQEVLDWVGLTENDAAEFARLNDGSWEFKHIATLIEHYHLITFEEVAALDSMEAGYLDELPELLDLARDRVAAKERANA